MTPFEPLRARLPIRDEPPPSGFLETSVALMLSPGASGLEALFIQRAERAGDPWSGHVGLPGGRREAGDADLLETALRETKEEIGVDLPRGSLIGALPDLQPSVPTKPALLIRPFVFGLPDRPATTASAEVAASFWIPVEALAAGRGTAKVSLKGMQIEVPCFRDSALPDGLVVWGLTYRILDGLLPLL